MNVLLISDLHDSSRGLAAIINFLSKEKNIDGVVFAGDMVNMGQPVEFAKKFIFEISNFNIPLLWVPGNNDFGQSYKVLQDHTKSLEGRIVKLGGREFTGIGGSPTSWESEYSGEQTLKKEDITGKILVSHYPPAGVTYYAKNQRSEIPALPAGRRNPNLTANRQPPTANLKDFPLVHICGHIHNTWGIGYIGQTKVIKLASSAFGYLAIMDLDSLEVEYVRVK